ncbi:MAG: hypothetical protein WAT36_05240, partial [Chromatiaceae bacterium]
MKSSIYSTLARSGRGSLAAALMALMGSFWSMPAFATEWTFNWNTAITVGPPPAGGGGVWPALALAPQTFCYSSTAPVNSSQSFYNSGYDLRVSLTRSGTPAVSASVSTANSDWEQYMDAPLGSNYGQLRVEFLAVSSRTGYTGGDTGTPCSGAAKSAYLQEVTIGDIDRVRGAADGSGSYYRDQIRVMGNNGAISPLSVVSISPTRTVTAANTGTNTLTASNASSLYVGMVVAFISGTPPSAFTLSTDVAVTYYCVTYVSGSTFSLGLPSGTPASCAAATT